MKKQVVHLTSETRRRALQLYRDLGVLLRQDASRSGLPARSGFCYVRPSLFQMFSHLWGKDDLSLTKVVFVDRPEYLDVKVDVPPCFVPDSDENLPF